MPEMYHPDSPRMVSPAPAATLRPCDSAASRTSFPASIIALLGMMAGQDAPKPSSIVPAPRTDGAVDRQTEVVRRVKDAKGPVSVVFVGDSITQGWEGAGKERWDAVIAPLNAINIGVSGDRTEHVLWRLNEAPLTPLAPKAIVLMIGTNNLGHGSSNAEETLLGVRSVIETLRTQCPEATVVVCGIFPRGERFNAMRGDILQINQVLGKLAGDHVVVRDFGQRFLKDDGSISSEIMPDFLHLSPAGYAIWADEMTPLLSRLIRRDQSK